ncbi:hypothetical protein P7C70_g21, partial [Phenoliferia sp. Uapishka_3]
MRVPAQLNGLLHVAARQVPIVLRPCTCDHRQARVYTNTKVSEVAAPDSPSPTPTAPTSAFDDPSETSSLHDRPPHLPAKQRRQKARRRLPIYDPPPEHTFPAPQRRTRADVAQFLPAISRERNYLLASFRHHINTRWSGQADAVWDALVSVLQYPAVRPTLPPSQLPSSIREEDHGDPSRLRINLSKSDLIRTMSVFSGARPRTRTGLSRMLVVVELLAMNSGQDLPPASARPPDGRDFEVGTLRGAGVGLGPREWRSLLSFAALSYRSPRSTPEASSAMSLFSQWSSRSALGPYGPLKPTVDTYNALLTVAARSRSYGLVEEIEERMLKEGVRGNARTLGIRMRMAAERGAHIDTLWMSFEDSYRRVDADNTEGDYTVMWNSIVWYLAQRGLFKEARELFLAMRSGHLVDLRKLAPPLDPPSRTSHSAKLVVKPPPPDEKTYLSLVQAYAHYGDLRGAMSVVEFMMFSKPPGKSTINTRLKPCEPTVEIFTPLFRGFASHGQTPDGLGSFDPHLLAGPRTRPNTPSSVQGSGLFPSLRANPASSLSLHPDADPSLWSLAALHRLFKAFLSIPPPPKSASLPYGGRRTAPLSKEIFWVILAFEKLSGGDSQLVLDVWDAVVETFGRRADHAHPGRPAWQGWMVDNRIRRRVEHHRSEVALKADKALESEF